MTLVVPFDGSELSDAALTRAKELGKLLDEDVVALSVIPQDNVEYAADRCWLESTGEFDLETVVSHLREQVRNVDQNAEFDYILAPRQATPGTIANNVRREARNRDATMVVLGSENAGRIVNRVSVVGTAIAMDDAYDVLIVRNTLEQ